VLQAIGHLEVQTPAAAAAAAPAPAITVQPPPRSLRILLAEDTAANQKLVTAILK
jgi:hypothetical protein